MGNTVKIKQSVKFDVKHFATSFILWLIGIILNILPIGYSVVKLWLSSDVDAHINYVCAFWGDIDFLCVNFGAAFLLLMEIIFLRRDYRSISNIIGCIVLAITMLLIITYTIAIFSTGWNAHVSQEFLKNANIVTLIIITVLGIIYFCISSSRKSKEVEQF